MEILNKYGAFEFEVIVRRTVTSGTISLNNFQRKKYHLKKYRSYSIRYCSLSKPRRTLFEIINERFDFKSQIGGMERVLEEIFGDVLLLRMYPQNFVTKTQMNKTRGILLHGPPGTGKSLVVQTICNVLNVNPKVVRGPEIFSCMLGKSEKKVRDLFNDVRREQEKFETNSKLNAIIFDEIDAVCKS